jgi:hypothetical protein
MLDTCSTVLYLPSAETAATAVSLPTSDTEHILGVTAVVAAAQCILKRMIGVS